MRESPALTEATQQTYPPELWMPLVALYYKRQGLNLSEEMRKNDQRLRTLALSTKPLCA